MTNFLFLEVLEEVLLLFVELTQVIIVSVFSNIMKMLNLVRSVDRVMILFSSFRFMFESGKVWENFHEKLQDFIFFLVIVDADRTGNTCHTALFNIGGTTATSRSWNVLVTHYACGDYDSSGYVLYHFGIYSRVWNKRIPLNKHSPWIIWQKE